MTVMIIILIAGTSWTSKCWIGSQLCSSCWAEAFWHWDCWEYSLLGDSYCKKHAHSGSHLHFVHVREPEPNELAEVKKDEEILKGSDEPGKGSDEDEFYIAPRNVIKIFDFWKIYASFLAVSSISTYIGNYDKAFGQIYIQVRVCIRGSVSLQ